MRLSHEQVEAYHRDGFLTVESLFDAQEVRALTEAYSRDSGRPGPQRIVEDGGEAVRTVYASHEREPLFARVVRDSRLLVPVQQLLTECVYVYQFKVNAKPAFGGDKWSWHQDYPAWRIADGLPAPRQVNIGVFLDEATEFNGPVVVVPGSHRAGVRRVDRRRGVRSAQHLDPDDIALTREDLADLVRVHGMHALKGPAGSAVFFSPEIVHGSAPNISPVPRRLMIVTYNDVANLPSWPGEPRPAYLVGRDTEPLRIAAGPLPGAVTERIRRLPPGGTLTTGAAGRRTVR
ncbi:phytanoyl-CoA dioxygenase family protein [Dactylosporangium fulvum]|uniref:Phytanoyl-CoA dioxygenase family protein n=1 Tax=Dactylosporangium fulvum TaxID=53359 RepID=A0ABY5VSU0_9ACTN|nr:phytanoyl-CoA dioxygenase family protein [Dactylosporangium fulvum]UWP79891.1 phytanoyl-CoA dioxygenase family protein [Dactylosporangium fulvum]